MAFDVSVGGTGLVKSFVGDTPVKRIYAGGTHVWPPISTKIVWVGAGVGPGNTSTFPTHKVGDLLVVVAIKASTVASGYTAVPTTDTAVVMGYRWATSTATAFGTWTGASIVSGYVLRGANTTTPIGSVACASGSGVAGTAITAPALTLTDGSGASLVLHNYTHDGTSGAWVNKVPANEIARSQNARTATNQIIDSQFADASAMTHSAVSTATSLWRTISFEVLPGVAVVVADTPSVGLIKGNADSGLFHTPDSPYYEMTVAEDLFETEEQAVAAGYVKWTREVPK